jgi:hypothetical protein
MTEVAERDIESSYLDLQEDIEKTANLLLKQIQARKNFLLLQAKKHKEKQLEALSLIKGESVESRRKQVCPRFLFFSNSMGP